MKEFFADYKSMLRILFPFSAKKETEGDNNGKIVLVIALLLFGSCYLQAQDTTKIKPLRVTRFYAGLVGVGAMDMNLKFSNTTDLMLGITSQLDLTKDFMVTADLIDCENLTKGLGGYYLSYGKAKDALMITAGQMSRPISIHRPYPVDPGRHFLPFSKSFLPAANTGFTIVANHGSGQLIVGLFNAKSDSGKNMIEYNAGIIQNIGQLNLRLSGLYSQVSKGTALTIKYKGSEAMFFSDLDSLASNFTSLSSETFGWNIGSVFVDQVYNSKIKKCNRLEMGWCTTVDADIFGIEGKVCFGIGWRQYPEKSVRVYFWPYFFRMGAGR